MALKLKDISARLDSYYEFDREPVSKDKFQGSGRFISFFSGEHVAATEFVIGAFFVLHGVTLKDIIIGLFFGNLLAVLSWAFICAPIAVRVRLTLYWYLQKIIGPGLTIIYNLINALLYCILAGAMISVSATAVGLAFNISTPALTDFLPNSVGWVVITIFVGTVVTVLAILGFEKLSQFSKVCVPWIFLVFIAGAIVLLPRFGEINSFSDLMHIASTKIWNGNVTPGQEKLSMWHIMFFAWFANLAMHIGLSDLATLRYAKKWWYGFYSAFGMYLGHMLAWLCSGVMVAAIGREMNPGLMAFTAAGVAGAAAVVLAGWTTANPTMYRAGLAFQALTPNWKRWKVTLIAGIVTTFAACFPGFFMQLLNFVAIYGLILMPIGAVVFTEHWIFPMLKMQQYRIAKQNKLFNIPAFITWIGTLVFCYMLKDLHLYFKWLPGYFFAVILYVVLSYVALKISKNNVS